MEQAGKTKLKILYLLDILNKHSDEENILTMGDIISMLEKHEISAERKSVSRDLELLSDFGYDICSFQENRKGYYMRSHNFEDSELRLLIDAVMSTTVNVGEGFISWILQFGVEAEIGRAHV